MSIDKLGYSRVGYASFWPTSRPTTSSTTQFLELDGERKDTYGVSITFDLNHPNSLVPMGAGSSALPHVGVASPSGTSGEQLVDHRSGMLTIEEAKEPEGEGAHWSGRRTQHLHRPRTSSFFLVLRIQTKLRNTVVTRFIYSSSKVLL